MKKTSRAEGLYLALVMALMYIPILLVVLYSFNASKVNSVWGGFSLKWYRELMLDRDLIGSLKNSIILATISSVSAGFIGTLGAVGLSKLNFKLKGVLDYVVTIPMLTPEIILGIAFLTFFTIANISFGLPALTIAHTSFGIPYVYMMVKSRLVGLDPSYVEAARDLGAGSVRSFFDITLPAISPAVLSGMILAFAMSIDDVVISVFLIGAKFNTLPVRIYTQAKGPISPKTNAISTLMLLATIILTVLAALIGRIKNKQQQIPKEELI